MGTNVALLGGSGGLSKFDSPYSNPTYALSPNPETLNPKECSSFYFLFHPYKDPVPLQVGKPLAVEPRTAVTAASRCDILHPNPSRIQKMDHPHREDEPITIWGKLVDY